MPRRGGGVFPYALIRPALFPQAIAQGEGEDYASPMGKEPAPLTVRDHLILSYANLASAHAALSAGRTQYAQIDFMIRSRLIKGLKSGSMSIRSLYADEREELSSARCCAYCGADNILTLDHLFPQARYNGDMGYNLVHACKTCNSSKGKKDLLLWYRGRDDFPPLLVFRRYLKLAMLIAEQAGCNDIPGDDVPLGALPFRISDIPVRLPALEKLHL